MAFCMPQNMNRVMQHTLSTGNTKTMDSLSELTKIITQGALVWNKWRRANPSITPVLDGIELTNLVLDGIDFSGLSFNNAHITQCSFKNARLISTSFRGATLIKNDFSNAKLIAANLQETNLTDCVIQGASIFTANTRGACMQKMDFRGHDLGGLNLQGCSFARSNLEGQVLAKLDLSGLDLEDANLTGADLSYTNFSGANLRRADLRDAKFCSTNFKNAELNGVDLRKADLSGLEFDGADLTGCDLREAKLVGASLEKANITGTKLWKIEMKGWKIAHIRCDFALWGSTGKSKTTYRRHEFERLYTQAATIELKYPHRLSSQEIATIPILIEHLQATHWGVILRLKTIVEVAGGTLVAFNIEEYGQLNPTKLKEELQKEAERILSAHLVLRTNTKMLIELKEEIAQIKERFWPRLLELAAEHEREQIRMLTVVFMDLKGFSSWGQDELSDKLALFRGLIKPILKKWQAGYPNMEGDSLRVTFRNASAALACACMIQGVLTAAGFEVRVGVELGEIAVVHNEVTELSDLEGIAVSMAARLEAAAEPGQVLASDRVKHYSEHRDLFSFEPVKVKLKKSIGDIKQGQVVECYSVKMLNPLQEI
ncbi:pentapeptide repeat [Saccharophagus degradans 2-40]|uniref:Pentapeptide repeat n=2 Tax=Saccharophagus degradans TaxID=86304 RepID=Q21PM8_SACD2|nr:pentapeptide repeat [Saccharophagus degradans 2-40]